VAKAGAAAKIVRQASLAVTRPTSSGSGESTPAQEIRPVEADKPVRRYTIKKGDTLSRIAAQHYGSRSKRVLDAIFDANRATMSSPDEIRVGQEIVLPAIEGISSPGSSLASAASASPPDQPAKSTAPKNTAYRYYQIKKGDRYRTIAREQLGDASRWREIAELNRDIFPDPSKIRYGVRIRLPANRGATTGERS